MAEYNPYGPPEEPSNPYAPPEASLRIDVPAYLDQSRLEPFSATAAVGRAWRIFKQDPLLILGAVWSLQLLNMFFQYIAGVISEAVRAQNPGFGTESAVSFVVLGISFVIQVWLSVGQAIVLVKAAQERPTSLNELVSGGRFFWPYLWGTILFSLTIGLVAAAIMFPLIIIGSLVGMNFNGQGMTPIQGVGLGIILISFLVGLLALIYASVRFYLYQFLVVDRGMGGFEALTVSFRITSGRALELFGSMLFAFLIGILGLLACLVGIIVTVPLGVFVLACGYSLIAGETWGNEVSIEKPAPEMLL